MRTLLPSVLIVAWLGLTAFGAPFFGKISSVSSTDLNTFLPGNAEAAKVNKQLETFYGHKAIPLVIVFEKSSGGTLSSDEMASIKAVSNKLSGTNGIVRELTPPTESEDAKAAILVVPLASDGDFKSIFKDLKSRIADVKLPVTATFTGPASFAHDLQGAFSGIDGTLLIVAVSVVFLILLAVYRSPFLPFIVLGSAMAALSLAVFAVYHLADAGIVQMNGQVQGILFILVIGAATDYSLLYIARYREELTNYESTWHATWAALRSSYQAIIAAGSTVTVGLLCLLLSDLGSNKALGPVGGLGIALAVLASLTLLPALLLVIGRSVFWPKKPHHAPGKAESHYIHNHPVWARIGALVKRHPRSIWIGSVLLLLIACIGVGQLKADGVSQSSLVLGNSEAKIGQKIMDAHFPSGSGAPAYIIVDKDKQGEVINVLDADKGVSSVSLAVSGAIGSMPVGKADTDLRAKITEKVTPEHDKLLATLRANIEKQMTGMPKPYVDAAYTAAAAKVPSVQQMVAQAYPFADVAVKVVDNEVLLQAVLTDPADSLAARDTVTRLRTDVKNVDQSAIIGGASALQLDTNLSSLRDIHVIIPAILFAITLILMVLLRAIVAPLALLLSTIISFGATMGISALLFNHLWQFPGADPAVIIFGFVFLVALGIDYNIFLMTRVREETAKVGVSKGTVKGLIVTGGVITSAGIVLAATFASLSVIPILFLVQIAFIVTFGVLLDTIIVRSLLVPSITLEIGRLMWWPSRLFRGKK